ncbi:MAG: hypothetical protein JXA25_19225 [Anaerolineales bacterium]|nr:hypothetical protein [Anaerolineales bacterium]
MLETAAAFPFFVVMFLAIMSVAWISWVQGATVIASLEAARASAYHQGESINPGSAHGRFYEAMSGIASSSSAGWIGAPQVSVDWTTRTVSVRVEKGISFSVGTISASHQLRSGTFTRIQDFFGGAPEGTWE